MRIKADILTRSGHRKEVDKSIASPEFVEVGKGRLRINDYNVAPMYVAAYPARVYEGWIASEFTWKPYLLDFVQFIEPVDEERIINALNRKITQLESKLIEMQEKGRTDTTSIEKELEYLYNYRERLVSRQTKLFTISTYFYILTKDEALDDYVEDFSKSMKARGCHLKRVRYKILESFKTLLPECSDKLERKVLVDSEAAASCFPFVFPTLMHDTGVLYGFDASTRSPIIVDRFSFAGHNEIVVGKIGSGKSFFARLEALRWYLNDRGIKIFLVDPLGGFKGLVSVLGAETVKVGRNVMNPLDLHVRDPDALRDKFMSLVEFFSTFFEEEIGSPMDKVEAGVLRKALLEVYNTKQEPTIADVMEALPNIATNQEEKGAAERIKSAMEAFSAEMSMFNGKTDVNVESRVIYFDFSAVEGVEKSPLPMHAVLTWIGSKVRAERGKKIVVIDEAHYFMQYRQIRKFLERSIRHSRHHVTGYTLVSQGYEEFTKYEEGRAIIENTDIHVIFRLERLPEDVKRILGISEYSERFVREGVQGKTAGYSTALLATPAGCYHMVVRASELEVMYLSE